MAGDKRERKRKREIEENERPNKKVAFENRERSIEVSIRQDGGAWTPVIASTPGINLPAVTIFKPYAKPRSSHRGGGTGPIAKSELLLHSSAHERLDYTGREEETNGEDGLLKHYVGVFDPKTGKLQVVQARKMVIRGTLKVSKKPETANGEEKEDPSNYTSARSILGETFGTKKSKKAIRSRTENAITPSGGPASSSQNGPLEPLASAVIQSMVATTSTMASREDLQAIADENKPRPKPNLAADTPAEVYSIEDLVGIDMLRMLPVKEWQDAVAAQQDIVTSSQYISKRIVKVAKSGIVKRLKTLRYLLILIEWYKSLRSGGHGNKRVPKLEEVKQKVPNTSDIILEKTRKRFSPEAHMNKWFVDNCLTHICALALTVDDFAVDVLDLMADLYFDTKAMTAYFKELGCRIVALSETERTKLKLTKVEAVRHKIAKLRLPLEFPKDSRPMRRK